jgi:hypothetical protein
MPFPANSGLQPNNNEYDEANNARINKNASIKKKKKQQGKR